MYSLLTKTVKLLMNVFLVLQCLMCCQIVYVFYCQSVDLLLSIQGHYCISWKSSVPTTILFIHPDKQLKNPVKCQYYTFVVTSFSMNMMWLGGTGLVHFNITNVPTKFINLHYL